MDVAEIFNWIHLILISGELIENLLVRIAAENFEFSGSVPQLSKLFWKCSSPFNDMTF